MQKFRFNICLLSYILYIFIVIPAGHKKNKLDLNLSGLELCITTACIY